MIKNYLKIAFRNIVRNKVYSFINIAGLAIGMAACMLISLWVVNELSYDTFNKNLDRIFLIPQTQHYKNAGAFTVSPTPAALAPFLKANYPGIEYAARYDPYEGRAYVSCGDKDFFERIAYADPDFMKIFTVHFLQGNPRTALSDPNSVVITNAMAKKYFGTAENVVGKVLTIDDKRKFKVTGLIDDIPENSSTRFNLLASMTTLRAVGVHLNNWGNNSVFTYVMLRKGIPYQVESARIKDVLHDHLSGTSAGDLFLFPCKDIHLGSIRGKGGRMTDVILFSIIAMITLLIACINFMNLATARASRRNTEVGIRKTIGAGRAQIAEQFFGEAILVSLISFVFSLLIVELFLPLFNELSGKDLSFANLPIPDVLLLAGIAVVTGIISGTYPAVYLSSFGPTSVFMRRCDRGSGNFMLRRGLVVFQFAISIFLIVSTIVIVGQLRYLINKDLGLDKKNIIYFKVDSSTKDKLPDLRNELMANPNIRDVSFTSLNPLDVYFNSGGWNWAGKDPRQQLLVSFLGVDYDFLKTFGVKLAEGRFFSTKHAADTSSSVVINQTFAGMIGGHVVGKILSRGRVRADIVGVVRDFNFTSLRYRTGPLLMYIDSSPNFVFIKMNREIPSTINYVQSVCKKFEPGFPFQYHFMDQTYEQNFISQTRLSKIFTDFAVLAIFISCLGLFGLASFTAEQKTKEIGIRKVLGASVPQVAKSLTLQFLVWVAMANGLAWPLAFLYLSHWLQNYPYRIQMNLWIYLASGLAALLIAVMTVGFQALRAATSNPVKSLRYE